MAGLALGIVVLLVGGVVAALQVTDEGPGSPQAAVEKLIAAANDEDLLGVLEALLPSERDAFRGSLEDLADELRRLEILSGSFDLGGLGGFDLEFSDLDYSVEEVGSDLALVRILSGTASFTVDPARLPLGGFVLDLVGDELEGADPQTDVEEITGSPEGAGIATVKHDGGWYVSLWYSVAEAARAELGLPRPDPADRIQPEGAEEPETAVAELLGALAAGDFRRVFELLPPDEARVLYDYSPLFIDDLEAAGREMREILAVDLRSLTTSSDGGGSRVLVQVSDVAADIVFLPGGVQITVEDGCTEIRQLGQSVGERICPGDEEVSPEELLEGFLPGVEPPELTLGVPELGFVATEHEGRWYVSPTRTLIDNMSAFLRIFDRADLDEIRRFVEDVLANLEGIFDGGEFAPPFPPELVPS